ncbi:MAG TPA: hypothetical protein VGM64_07010 [Lacunisphaera sp.]|jgi:hypothetical protein
MNILKQEVQPEAESWRLWLFLSISVFLWALALDSAKVDISG